MIIRTGGLSRLAHEVVNAKLLLGAIKGQRNWDNDHPDTKQVLKDEVQRAVWDGNWANVITYATMLAAREYNATKHQEELENATSRTDGPTRSPSTAEGTAQPPRPVPDFEGPF